MSGTQELFDAIGSDDLLWLRGHDFDADEFVRLLGPRIVQTSGKNYAFAMHKEDPTDCSDRTDYFDWHSDGLYHAEPPRFVLLHCIDAGAGQINTDLAATNDVVASFSTRNLRTLCKLRSHYIGHGGIFGHPILADAGMLLASRGYISPLLDLSLEDQPTIREIAKALSELCRSLDEHAVPYEWKAGTTLVFNQYRYMHRRNSAFVDRDRKLIRMWFN
jgi:alpha-ketoglutarate-dependent taurine dioxygenase